MGKKMLLDYINYKILYLCFINKPLANPQYLMSNLYIVSLLENKNEIGLSIKNIQKYFFEVENCSGQEGFMK